VLAAISGPTGIEFAAALLQELISSWVRGSTDKESWGGLSGTMAKRPSTKEILEAARKGGPARPSEAGESVPEPETAESAVAEQDQVGSVERVAAPAKPAAPAPERPAAAAKVPTPSTLGRPLTLKEKLAAARTGGAAQPGSAQAAAPASPRIEAPPPAEEVVESSPAEEPKSVPPPAKPLGRPMTLQEKLAAARGGGAKSAAAAPAGGAKPAAAKPVAAPAAKTGAARVLPPLEKISDPRDLAEAARQAAAKRAKDDLAAKAAGAPAPVAKPKAAPAKPQTVPPRPDRALAAAPTASATATAESISRRGFFVGGLLVSWIAVAWTTFTAGLAAMTAMTVRFMFPNVLAEPPSTIKIGLPTNFDPEDVSDRFKAEWGFWVVRSTKYNGQDIIYALQSVCTHLGCPPNWLASEQKFKCPCHGSGFYISGINFEGPAPRPLERFKVALADDGQIIVDKSQKFQQELGQWSDADSFIPA
jgi:cytochrome b6-f complex iron-sulfur subunit